MRLTVGPLPPAVYWRRRALVVGVLVVIVAGIIYAVSNDPAPGTGPNLANTSSPTTAAATGTATTTPTPFTLPVTTAAGEPATTGTSTLGPNCRDDEIQLTATSSTPEIQVNGPNDLALTIKNISNRTCIRNIGSIPQELQLRAANSAIVWSSDDCATGARYDYFQEFTPGFVKSFGVYWDGYRSRDANSALDCERPGQRPPGGTYNLVARLGTLFSAPTPVTVLSGS